MGASPTDSEICQLVCKHDDLPIDGDLCETRCYQATADVI